VAQAALLEALEVQVHLEVRALTAHRELLDWTVHILEVVEVVEVVAQLVLRVHLDWMELMAQAEVVVAVDLMEHSLVHLEAVAQAEAVVAVDQAEVVEVVVLLD
jgi:hypothetical protein